MYRVYHAFESVFCSIQATCCQKTDLLALVCDVLLCFCGILGQVWYLNVSIPDRCHLCYLDINSEVYTIYHCEIRAVIIPILHLLVGSQNLGYLYQCAKYNTYSH